MNYYNHIGIIGGGQLGRMFIQEALNFGVKVDVLDSDTNCPCRTISNSFFKGSPLDFDTVVNFGKNLDLVTVEMENVNTEALEFLEQSGVKVFPQPSVLKTIRDKGIQKNFFKENGIPTSDFKLIEGKNGIDTFPIVQKKRKGGYDGRGVQILKSKADLDLSFDEPSVLERLVNFEKELSVIVSRNESGEIQTFPVVECQFNEVSNLVEFLFSPADISPEIETLAKEIAKTIVEKLNIVGLLAVEFFLVDGKLLVNEIAPRPHNSGHHTIECCKTSQFEQHLRSILNLPLGNGELIQPGIMINLIGESEHLGPVHYENIEEILKLDGANIHLYGKEITKPNRKMGHITLCGNDIENLKLVAKEIQKKIRVISK